MARSSEAERCKVPSLRRARPLSVLSPPAESWFEVGSSEGGEGGELVPSSSQEHMEEMLAAAVSEGEPSDSEAP